MYMGHIINAVIIIIVALSTPVAYIAINQLSCYNRSMSVCSDMKFSITIFLYEPEKLISWCLILTESCARSHIGKVECDNNNVLGVYVHI